MLLQHIHVDGVRNLLDVTLRPHPRLTVLVGDNGQGKTNLLEAIHLVSALRPLRPVERASELVGFGREHGRIVAQFDVDGPLEVAVNVEPRGRKATIGGKSVRDVAVLSSQLSVVSFVPDDATMIRGAPGDRRRGLDRFAFALFPQFAAASRRFEEALEHRNRLLKDVVVDEDALAAFTPPFISAAVELTRLRAEACARWAPVFSDEARALGGDALAAELKYDAGLVDDDGDVSARSSADLEIVLEERLRRGREIEKRKKSTLCGPQHDDVVLLKLGKKARFLASQGEARALVLALKLASVRLLTAQRGQGPLLLLDDVAGELDKQRAGRLLASIDEHGAQAFVTTTDTTTLPALGESLVVSVSGGRLL
ncbi:MAG: DNA replication and repair protein RecF [Deltaproteobacteria bacterium]|nr:DNA replication and repair protein RecF [Deltaproteobacteria bacterium]